MAEIATSVYSYPLTPGRRLIEASAGTGKTYTITELYRRLILENKFRTKDILVVTFSKAAAAELKERISSSLNEALRKGWKDENDNLVKPKADEQLLLQLALASFDEAVISTIHSFCQKALTDFAVESGEALSSSLIESNDEFTNKLIWAFWRQKFGNAEDKPAITMENLQNLAKKISDYSNAKQPKVMPQDHIYVNFLDFLKRELPSVKQEASVIQFEDLVIKLRDALLDRSTGDRLSERIRNRYKAVFVDEFQDTDDAQYQVFDKCFPKDSNTVFYMIGDPKQAIYAFRGADIYAYLQAKKDTEPNNQFTLPKNYRSAPELINAVSEMFSGRTDAEAGTEFQHSFLQDGIPFVQVTSGRNNDDFYITENGKPIKDHFIARFHFGGKTNLRPQIIQQTAKEIASLLSKERDIKILDEKKRKEQLPIEEKMRPLKASDIAILVQQHDQGAELQQELRKYNINAAANDKSNVFTSPEAEKLEIVLRAIIEPGSNHIRCAMMTDFYQASIETINTAVQAAQDSPLESWREFFHSLGENWRTRGFAAMFTTLLDNVLAPVNEPPRLKILTGPNGERAMTNYLHLMELLRRTEISRNFTPENTLDYLRNARMNGVKTSTADADKSTDPNSSEMRLDKDSDTVQIVTLFSSKGLQYPVVFLPFPIAGVANKPHKQEVGLHTRDSQGTYFDFDDPADPFVSDLYRKEKLRTQLRLLYVALTRAEYLCFTDWMLQEKSDTRSENLSHSAAGALYLNQTDGTSIEDRLNAVFNMPKDKPASTSAPWTQASTEFIKTEYQPNLTEHPAGTLRQLEEENTENLTALEKPSIPHTWRTISYSSFSYGKHSSDGIRDLDEDSDNDNDDNTDDDKKQTEEPVFHDFPRGDQAGTFFHNMLEYLAYPAEANTQKLTFADFAPDADKEEAVRMYLKKQLTFQGYDTKLRLEQLREGLSRLFTTPLTEEQFNLSSIDLDKALPELEFTLNIPDRITLKKLLSIIRENGGKEMELLPEGRKFKNGINGLLNGVIDLIFLHNGKYYIADYKTNKLKSYSKDSVWKVMADCGYILQAYLYTMAFYRLMKQRKNDFSFETDFGGILYLFPKGMDRHGHGIWQHKPSEKCIRELLDLTGNGVD